MQKILFPIYPTERKLYNSYVSESLSPKFIQNKKIKKLIWRPIVCIILGILGIVARLLLGETLENNYPIVGLLFSGGAVVAAAFLLAWGAEALQVDLSSGLSTAILALIAVLPEYSVDFYFTWTAAHKPENTAYAAANMTGANRLLIGVGWSLVVLFSTFIWRKSKVLVKEQDKRTLGITLLPNQSVDLFVLMLATVWSLLIPLTGHIAPWHGLGMVVIFGYYIFRIRGFSDHEPELVGVASVLGNLPKVKRRLAVGGLLTFSGGILLACSEPFAKSLILTGEYFHVSKFLLVQWLAPLASEAPELLVALIFSLRGHGQAGLAALLSSKVNQWTLLVGTLPFVYSISSKKWAALPLDAMQKEEFVLTAAQSLLAISILAKGTIWRWEAFLLLGLFLFQFPFPADRYPSIRYGMSIAYICLALFWLIRFRKVIWKRIMYVFKPSSSERNDNP